MATLADLLSRLDPDPYRRGKQFEHICKWFLTTDPLYSRDLQRVWLWKEWPNAWSDAEAGIDLVAEDRDGKLWAIQAKCYADTQTITKHDIDTFLSESSRSQFSFRLLIATTARIGATARRTLDEQEKPASVLLRDALETAAVGWPSSPDDLAAAPLARKEPLPHQREAIDSVVRGLEAAERGQLLMACGTGKTLTALFIAEELSAIRTLVLVPSLSLLAQTLREWTANGAFGFEFRPVCSDETVADPDAPVAHTSDLGFPVTTDPEDIARFLRRRSGPRVVFSTYQSSPQIAKAFALGRVPAFDLVIADEAHRCAGLVTSAFATILDSTAIKARRRLFMTATPRFFTGRVSRAAREADFEVASMDDEAVFGSVLHRLGFAAAIERKLLTDYQVAVIGVDDATYRKWADCGRFVARDGVEVTDARTLAGQIGLAKAMRKYDLNRVISFHSRVKGARAFADSLPEVVAWMPANQRPRGRLWCDHASGEMSAGDRRRLLQRLDILDGADRGLLANARCLAQGVDVPTLDGVAFIDPRRAEVDIVQAVGRAIRLAPDKTIGTIVIPVFIDTDDDPEVALNDSTFKPVWDILKALRAHDDWLGSELDALRQQLGRQDGRPHLPGKIHLDLPVTVGADFARAFDVRLVEQTTPTWEFWFGLMEAYVAEYGNACPPRSCNVNGYQLGAWVNGQRQKYLNGQLHPDRLQRLSELPGWVWEFNDSLWQVGYTRLLKYIERHGDAAVPVAYVSDGFRLGGWVNVQRDRYVRGELEPDRQRQLQSIDCWSWSPRDDQWQKSFQHLLAYIKQNGHAQVPQSYKTSDGIDLGNWVSIQRGRYNKRTLERDRLQRLDVLAEWTWSAADYDGIWEEQFSRLQRYIAAQGDSLVPQRYGEDGSRLGSWVTVQRHKYAKGVLDPERQHRLDTLEGWFWDARAARWEIGFQHLQGYAKQHGDALVPGNYEADDRYKLGKWVNTQRVFYSKGRLSLDRIRRLELVNGWAWDASEYRGQRRSVGRPPRS